MTSPLAQLADLFPQWVWNALVIAGLGAPGIALVIRRFVFHGQSVGWREVVIGYYVFALPLAGIVFGGSDSAGVVCPFFVFMPVGMLIGLFVLMSAPAGRRRRADAGVCAVCGYDLRATPNRCPECGTVPAHSRDRA